MPTLSFPPYEIDVRRHVLLRDGVTVDLSPRLVEILGHLAAHHGETITKESLLDRFWPDVHVTENTLTRAIADIRHALEDDASTPRFIQTVARRGYRFIAQSFHGPQVIVDKADIDPFREWVKGRLSLERLDANQLDEALAAFKRAVTATPAYAPAHAGLANAYFLQYERTRFKNIPARDLLELATSHARQTCELDPSLGEAWATLGFILTASGDVEQARAAARRATALEPSSWRHQFRLAVATWGEERLRAVDRTLTLMPDFAPARFVAGMVFVARQAFDTAEDLFARGASRQSQQADANDALFPSFGLHWLHGLLLLRRAAIGDALRAFTREIDSARESNIYSAEFRLNAVVASGFAHLAARDADGALRAFRSALELHHANARALIGLTRALVSLDATDEATHVLRRTDQARNELVTGGRLAEATLVAAAAESASGRTDVAIQRLERLLDQAPPGQIGWQIPIDPALALLREHPAYDRLTARLAARAS